MEDIATAAVEAALAAGATYADARVMEIRDRVDDAPATASSRRSTARSGPASACAR